MMAAPAIIKKNVKSIKKYKIEFITLSPLNLLKKQAIHGLLRRCFFIKKLANVEEQKQQDVLMKIIIKHFEEGHIFCRFTDQT